MSAGGGNIPEVGETEDLAPGFWARQLLKLPGVHWEPPAPKAAPAPSREDERPLHVSRFEVVLAADPRYPLARPNFGADNDPLHQIAQALQGLSNTKGESFEMHLDLLPVTPARQRHLRSQVLREDSAGAATDTRGASLRQSMQMVAYGVDSASTRATRQPTAPPRLTPLQRTAATQQARELGGKILALDEAWWDLQMLMVARSPKEGRAEQRLAMVFAALQQFGDQNHFQVYGQRLGPFYLGSDVAWRRRRFDHRLRTGAFAPPKSGGWVTTGEIGAFLKPPTQNLQITNIARSGGPVPPPPKTLPLYRGPRDRHLLPMGWVRDNRGWRPAGVPLEDTFFELLVGKSRSGKTERMLGQFVHLALAGHGGMYLDPHVQAIERMKPFLGSVADRVLEFNLSRTRASKQAGFNLLSMTGRDRADIEGRISAVVSAFSAALGWSAVNNRAQNLVTQSVWSLCELGLVLPPELQPTVFQITTILSDEEWRAHTIPHLPRDVASFWQTRFNNLEKSAITPVTNLLDRLRSSPSVAALLGTPQSTYDARRAMDEGKIILASPAGTGDKDRFLACFFLYDVFLAALSRQDTGLPMDKLRTFWLAVDEMQIYDTAGSVLELMLRETAKYGLKVFGATQSLTVLQKATQDMWLTNRSHIISNAERAEAARILSKEMGDVVEPKTFTRLERFCSIGQLTLNKQTTTPIWMRGFDSADIFADYHDPKAPAAIAAAVDANLARKPVEQTLEELRTLDERIAAYLNTHIPRSRVETQNSHGAAPGGKTTGAKTKNARPQGAGGGDPQGAEDLPPGVTKLRPRRPRTDPPAR
jgi:hypothetical protein